MKLTNDEKGILSIVRSNELFGRKEIKKTWNINRLEIQFEWRSKNNLWGRFGGGWNWKLGIQIGSTTIILSLLVFSLTFHIKKSEVPDVQTK